MPSFDIVSEYDAHEATNAVDQANREVTTRFDFKGSGAIYELLEDKVTMSAGSEFQLQQMLDILQMKLTKRGVDIGCLDIGEARVTGKTAQQIITLRQGLESLLAKKIVKLIKDKKLKVQAAIQGEKVRVTGKKKDDLQEVIQMLKQESFDMPLQFNNFRD
ncbi:MAG: YajQ family cyclic di-GMP-binding protein [Gammaproteobacteria bacterium]